MKQLVKCHKCMGNSVSFSGDSSWRGTKVTKRKRKSYKHASFTLDYEINETANKIMRLFSGTPLQQVLVKVQHLVPRAILVMDINAPFR